MASIDRGYRVVRQTRHASGPGPSPLLWIATGMLATFLFLAGVILFYQALYADRVVPGVSVAGIDVGARSPAEAEATLAAAFDAYNQRPLTITVQGRQWKLTPAQLGMTLAARATAARALRVGHEDDLLTRSVAQLQALQGGAAIEPEIAFDEAVFEAAVRRITSDVGTPFVDAGISLRDGRVSATPPQAGIKIDSADLRQQLEARLRRLSADPISLSLTRNEPTRTLEQVQPLVQMVQRMTGSNLTLAAPGTGKAFTITGRDILGMLVVEDNGRGGVEAISIRLDPAKVAALGERLAKEVNQEPQNARYAFENGNLRQIAPGRDGLALDKDAFPAFLEEAARAEQRTASLPVTVTQPWTARTNSNTWGITERIYRQATNYGGGAPERIQNVELGARLLHGVVIPPGETFSFNQVIGPITREAGFQLGFAIVENETVPDAGGGICQVSTTLFQAAFFAGYPIVERWAHAYDITRYHAPYAGLDATVYHPQLDFKFRNPQETALLIQTATDGRNLYVSLFGTKPGWTVTVERPVITNVRPASPEILRQESPELAKGREYWVERAEDGKDIAVTRTVTEPGGEARVGTFKSSYRPQRNILLVGTGGEPPKPPQVINPSGTPVAATATATPRPGPTATATPRR